MHERWIQARERKESTAVLLWDLSAAFDTLDHNIFLKKLALYGLSPDSVNWFTSYLGGRKQLVQVGGKRSRWRKIPTGSPQGAILSPLIFNIFVADLELWVSEAAALGYADDMSTSVSHVDVGAAIQLLEKDAREVLTFMSSNYLVANPKKTSFMVMPGKASGENMPLWEITIGESKIKESTSEKLLGMRIAQDLTWKEHIEGTGGVCSTLRQRVLVLRRLSYTIPRDSLQQIADGLILSKIRYGLNIYGIVRISNSDPKNKQMKEIQVLLNRLMRILTGSRQADRIPITELLSKTGWLSLNQMIAQSILMEAWKINSGRSPSLEELLPRPRSDSVMITKSQARGDLLVTSGSRIKQNSFSCQAAKIWNKAPIELREARSRGIVKRLIKKFVQGLPE
jgi:hypothetical protein